MSYETNPQILGNYVPILYQSKDNGKLLVENRKVFLPHVYLVSLLDFHQDPWHQKTTAAR